MYHWVDLYVSFTNMRCLPRTRVLVVIVYPISLCELSERKSQSPQEYNDFYVPIWKLNLTNYHSNQANELSLNNRSLADYFRLNMQT